MSKILTFDTSAESTGWALIVAGQIAEHGSFPIPSPGSSHMGKRYWSFHARVSDLITTHAPDLIALEAPIIRPGRLNAARVLQSLPTLVQMIAYARDIPCIEIPNKEWKAAVIGTGSAEKEDTIRAMQALGFNPANDDEADAMALGVFVLGEYGGLMRGRKIPANFTHTHKRKGKSSARKRAELQSFLTAR